MKNCRKLQGQGMKYRYLDIQWITSCIDLSYYYLFMFDGLVADFGQEPTTKLL